MPYLSRVWINPLRRQARALLASPQKMHAAVLGGLPTQPVTERVLWRIDSDNPRRPGLLVVTRSEPSWEHVVEQAGWPSADDPVDPQVVVRPYEPFLERIADGQQYAFRLTANPVQSTRRPIAPTASQRQRASDEALPRSVRLGHRTTTEQMNWFLTRVEKWGFAVPPSSASDEVGEVVSDARITGRERRSFRRGGKAAGDGVQVTVQAVTYEGRMIVQDSHLLRDALLNGIGPAKAYGCGLLTLAPLSMESGGVVAS